MSVKVKDAAKVGAATGAAAVAAGLATYIVGSWLESGAKKIVKAIKSKDEED